MTPFRAHRLGEFANSLSVQGKKFKVTIRHFVENAKEFQSVFGSINIAQSDDWNYSSPVRIYRSLKNGLLPIVAKKFNDHPIEDLAVITDINTPLAFEAALKTKLISMDEGIQRYNRAAGEINEVVRGKVARLWEKQKRSNNEVIRGGPEVEPLNMFGPLLVQRVGRGSVVEYRRKFHYIAGDLGDVRLETLSDMEKFPGIKTFSTKAEAILEGMKNGYTLSGGTPKRTGRVLGHDIVQ